MKSLFETRIVPVVKIDNIEDALPLAKALSNAGQKVIEVTLRTPAGAKAIELLNKETDMIVGAGTVVNIEQAEDVISKGAKFIVSPGTNVEVVKLCHSNNITVFPGAVTPTEIMALLELGVDIVKFFPAGIYGGLKALKALSAPFPNIKFIPTGGVSAGNLGEFLAFDKIVAVGGSWMVAPDLIKEKDWNEIERLTKEAVDITSS
jgi:2-dehydro-3-deoxyphosphogluconate aldolase/(4S)-4-hydroxy-2-oxoglutarate aldolase